MLDILFFFEELTAEGSSEQDQASAIHMAIFHEHIHETRRCRIHNPIPVVAITLYN